VEAPKEGGFVLRKCCFFSVFCKKQRRTCKALGRNQAQSLRYDVSEDVSRFENIHQKRESCEKNEKKIALRFS